MADLSYIRQKRTLVEKDSYEGWLYLVEDCFK